MNDVATPQRPRRHRMARTVFALVLREMTTTYGKSVGGYLWAVLEPVGAVLLLAIVFSIAFHSPPLGSNFALFYASGYLVFNMYSVISVCVANALRFSRPLLEFPAVSPLDALFARFLLNFLTQIMVFYIVMAAIILVFGLKLILSPEAIVLSMTMTAALALGVGVLNSFLFMAFPVFERLWSILNRPLFIISGVLFLYEDVPGFWRELLWWNPLIHVIGEMRAGFYGNYDASYVSPLYIFGISAITLTLGLLLLKRFLHVALKV